MPENTTIEKLQERLHKATASVNDKANFLQRMGLAMPDPLVITKIRMEFILSKIAQSMEDGDEWLLELECEWAEDMADMFQKAISQQPPETRRQGLHVIGKTDPDDPNPTPPPQGGGTPGTPTVDDTPDPATARCDPIIVAA